MLVVIPIRSGSKRLKNKNLKDFNNKPLYMYAIEQAMRLSFKGKIILTTDINQKKLIIPANVIYDQRPKHLASDEASAMELGQYVWQKYKENDDQGMLWLQVTSPLRWDSDLEQAYQNWLKYNHVVGCCLGDGKNTMIMHSDGTLHKTGEGKQVNVNGAFYFLSCQQIFLNDWISGAHGFVMPRARSVDIDTIDEWNDALNLLSSQRSNIKDQ